MGLNESSNDYSEMQQAVVKLLEVLFPNTKEPVDRDDTSRHIMRAAMELFGADYCAISLINPVSGRFIDFHSLTRDSNGNEQAMREEPRIDKFTQDVINIGPLFVNDLDRNNQYDSPFINGAAVKSVAGVSLYTKSQRRLLAVLYTGYKHLHEFSENDKILLRLLAEHSSSILQHSWSLWRYQKVSQIGQEINQDLSDVENLFEKLRSHLPHILGANYFFMLAVYNPQPDTLSYYKVERGQFLEVETHPLNGICELVIKSREPLIINHYTMDKHSLTVQPVILAGVESYFPESMMFMPLKLREAIYGVLSVQQEFPNAYDREDQHILELLSNHVALALGNMRLFESLSRLNTVGQKLTRQLNSQQVLDKAINLIRENANADLVTLYPFSDISGSFEFPTRTSGQLIEPEFPKPNYSRPDDIATLTLNQDKATFASESGDLYKLLRGDPSKRLGNFEVREKIVSTAAVPLLVGVEKVGALFINFRRKQLFTSSQQQLIEGLANYAAIAIKNSREFNELTQRSIELTKLLREIDREISKTLNLNEILDKILIMSTEYLQRRNKTALTGAILLYNSLKNQLQVKAAIGTDRDLLLNLAINLDDRSGMTYRVYSDRTPALARDVHDEEWRDWYFEVNSNTVSELDVPLLDENENVIGVIRYESSEPGRFDLEDQEFLVTLANQAVLAIKNAQAYERENRRADELAIIQKVERQIVGHKDFHTVTEIILEEALKITRSTTGVIMLYDPKRGDLYSVAERGVLMEKSRGRMSLDQGVIGRVVSSGEYLNVNVCESPWKEVYERWIPDVCWELAVPMIEGEQVIGVINIESIIDNPFAPVDVRLLTELADLAVIALVNSSSYKNAEEALVRFQLLYQAGQELAKITDLEKQLDEAYGIVVRAFSKRSDGQIVVRRYEEDAQLLVVVKVGKEDETIVPFHAMDINDGVNGLVARSKQTVIIDDTLNPPEGVEPHLSDPETRSLVVMPIIFGDQYYGNLALSHQQAYRFNEADLQLAEGLAQQLAITIQRLETVKARQNAEQRANESEVMGLIGQSATELTHRLANDLAPIRAWVSNIQLALKNQGVAIPKVAENLDFILRDVGVVLAFTGRLKQDVADMEEGRLVYKPEVIPIQVLLDNVRQMFSSLPENVYLVITPDAKLPNISVVPSQIVDILYNLITNAVEAMPEGGTVTVRARSVKRLVEIEVADTGVGISPEELPKIFSLFYSTKESSGFGLFSALRNALANNGNLSVQSVPGVRTVFTLSLPEASDQD